MFDVITSSLQKIKFSNIEFSMSIGFISSKKKDINKVKQIFADICKQCDAGNDVYVQQTKKKLSVQTFVIETGPDYILFGVKMNEKNITFPELLEKFDKNDFVLHDFLAQVRNQIKDMYIFSSYNFAVYSSKKSSVKESKFINNIFNKKGKTVSLSYEGHDILTSTIFKQNSLDSIYSQDSIFDNEHSVIAFVNDSKNLSYDYIYEMAKIFLYLNKVLLEERNLNEYITHLDKISNEIRLLLQKIYKEKHPMMHQLKKLNLSSTKIFADLNFFSMQFNKSYSRVQRGMSRLGIRFEKYSFDKYKTYPFLAKPFNAICQTISNRYESMIRDIQILEDMGDKIDNTIKNMYKNLNNVKFNLLNLLLAVVAITPLITEWFPAQNDQADRTMIFGMHISYDIKHTILLILTLIVLVTLGLFLYRSLVRNWWSKLSEK